MMNTCRSPAPSLHRSGVTRKLSINLQFIELRFAPAQVAHVTGDVQFPTTKDGQVGMGWAAGQVATTADFSHGSWFWTHFSGGLNYQVSLRVPD